MNMARAVCNGTAALHVACFAANIVPGDEVIVATMTFAASSNAVHTPSLAACIIV